MATSIETEPEFPRLRKGSLLQIRARPRLAALAERIEARYGPSRATAAQPKSVLESAARRLASSRGDLGKLTHRERKASVELCWMTHKEWVPDDELVSRWLAWAERDWDTDCGMHPDRRCVRQELRSRVGGHGQDRRMAQAEGGARARSVRRRLPALRIARRHRREVLDRAHADLGQSQFSIAFAPTPSPLLSSRRPASRSRCSATTARAAPIKARWTLPGL